MKSSISGLLALVALCTAQAEFANLPNCAKPCASSLPPNCHLDVKCICSDKDWISGISCCIKNACSQSDQEKTLQVAVQLCDTVSVTLPSAASCPSGASTAAAGGESKAASAVSNAFNVASSAVAGGGAIASSAVAGGKATVSSAVSGASITAESATSAAGNTANSATESPTSSTGTSSTSAQAATGAAQAYGSNMGAVGAAVAALALL